MTYHWIECERVKPEVPEAYICRWEDRNALAIALFSDGKGTIIKKRPADEHSKGITKHTYALIIVDSYSPVQEVK